MNGFWLNTKRILQSIVDNGFKSIYLRNSLLIISATLLPLTILGLLLFNSISTTMKKELESVHIDQMERMQTVIDNEIQKADAYAQLVLSNTSLRPLQSETEFDTFNYTTLDNLGQIGDLLKFCNTTNDLFSFMDIFFSKSNTIVRSNFGMSSLNSYEFSNEIDFIRTAHSSEKSTNKLLLTSEETDFTILRLYPLFSYTANGTDILIIGLNNKKLCGFLGEGNPSVSNYLANREKGYVLDVSGSILPANESETILSTLDKSYVELTEGKSEIMFVSSESIFDNWYYVSRIDTSDFYNQLDEFIRSFLVFTLITILFVIIFSFAIMQKTSEPIVMFQSIVSNPGNWIGQHEISADKRAETAQIAKSFLSHYKKSYELEASLEQYVQNLKTSQIAALSAQINPHLIYNTLDAIYWSIYEELGVSSRLPGVITSLSDILRYALQNNGNLVTIEDEYNHAKSYITIMLYRYDYCFHVTWDIDPDILDRKIVKITLQPLIENSLSHGIDKTNPDAEIHISIHRHEDVILVKVTDNGKGMSEEKIKELNDTLTASDEFTAYPGNHIGIFNLYLRYRLILGKQTNLYLESNSQQGITSTVICPML